MRTPSGVTTRFLFFFLVLALLGGCKTSEVAVPAGSRYVVSSDNAQFYKYGPAQSFGPDFVVPKGQRLTMLQRSFGYSRVTTDAGVTGYIASDDIAPAPPEPAAPPQPDATGATSRPKRSNVRGTPGEPLFDVNDVPMPLPTDPPKAARKAEPGFRY
jgi:hypothetical protein